MSRGRVGQAKQRHCKTFWLSGGTNRRFTLGTTQLGAPMASCCGAGGFAHVQDSVQTEQNRVAPHADRRHLPIGQKMAWWGPALREMMGGWVRYGSKWGQRRRD
jgi:hypothetical protein